MATQIARMAWTQAWQVALLAAAVWLATRLIAGNRPHFAHALWLVVLVKCVTPPVWSSPSGLFCWLQPAQRSASESASEGLPRAAFAISEQQPWTLAPQGFETADVDPQFVEGAPLAANKLAELVDRPQIENVEAEFSTISQDATVSRRGGWSAVWKRVQDSWPYVWLSVAAIWAVVTAIRYAVCSARLRRNGQLDNTTLSRMLSELAVRLRLRRMPRLVVTNEPVGPAVIGVLRPTVVLPAALVDRCGAAGLAPLLAHELIHIRRGDLWVGLLQMVTRALWWFHPLVWLAAARVTREAERSCDEEVIAELVLAPGDYARRLVDVLELKRTLKPFPALAGVRPVDITSQRLERIMRLEQGCTKRTPWWCWLVMLGATAICLPGAAFVLHAEEESAAANRDANDVAENTDTTAVAEPVQGALAEPPDVRTSIDDGFLSLETEGWRFRVVSGGDLELRTNGKDVDLRFRHGECEILMTSANERPESRIAMRADEVQLTTGFDRMMDEHVHELSLAGDAIVRRTGAGEIPDSTLRADRIALQLASGDILIRADGVAEITAAHHGNPEPDAPQHEDLASPRALDTDEESRFWVHVLSTIVNVNDCQVFDPPSDEEVWAALAKKLDIEPQPLPGQGQGERKVRIVKEKIADYVDERHVIPLIGPGRVHHAHYKCTVHLDERPHVVYVDHQHIHMLGGENAKDQDALDSPSAPRSRNEPGGVHIGHLDVRRLAMGDAEWQKLLAEREVRQRLNQPVEMSFRAVPLKQALNGIAESIGINVVIDEEGLQEADVKADLPVTLESSQPVSARSALQLLLAARHLAYAIDGELVRVTSAERARGTVYLIAYKVSDLVTPIADLAPAKSADGTPDATSVALSDAADFESLIQLITTTVSPDSWINVGGVGRIVASPENMCLVVGQTEDIHEQIADLIHRLHEMGNSHLLLDVKVMRMPADAPSNGAIEGILRENQETPCVLDADQRNRLIDAAQADRQTSILQHQVVVRNGQQVVLPLRRVNRQESAIDARLALLPIVKEGTRVSLGAGFRKGQHEDDAMEHHDVAAGQSLLLQGKGRESDQVFVIVSFSRR